jgi:hypothetical protein
MNRAKRSRHIGQRKMKRIELILFVTGALSLLASCDPARMIILKNKTGKPACIRWTIRADSTSTNDEQEFRTVTFDLGTSKSDRKKTITFGFGNWPADEIERFVNEDIQSIEIESVHEKRILTDKSKLKNYLLKRRHGLFKNFITIKL